MTTPDRDVAESIVDDATYDLLQALTSKLEAIEAYQRYVRDEQDHARRLLDALRNRVGSR